MATYGHTFTSGDTVTPTKLNNARTVSEIVNADVSATAAIAGTKIAPDFGSQNAVTTGTVTAAKLIPTGTSATGNGVYLPAANTVAVSTDGTERMRVTATGAVCVNTTTTDGYLNVGSGSGQFPNGIVVKPTSHATSRRAGAYMDNWGLLQDSQGNGTKDFILYDGTANASRISVTTAGAVCIGSNQDFSVASGSVDGFAFAQSGQVNISANNLPMLYLRRRAGNGTVVQFYRDTTGVGNISVTTTATAFNTSSDHRLKENVQPMTGALEKVAEMKPVTFDWKVNGEKGQGFIAHELQAVAPEAVTGAKDAVDADGKPEYQGVDPSKLVAILVAAVKELSAKVAALEAK